MAGMAWKRSLLIGIAAVVVAVVGGTWVYVNVISREPAPLSLPTSGPRTVADTATDGTWKVAGDSVVGYRVEEVLFGQNNTAVGRTKDIEGEITVSGTSVTSGSITVDMTTIERDESRRDNQFHGRIMQTAQFPTATFGFTDPIDVGSAPGDGDEVKQEVSGELTLHGVTKQVTFEVTGRRSGGLIQVSGSIPIVFADYEIDDPSGGPARTEDNGLLEFSLEFEHA